MGHPVCVQWRAMIPIPTSGRHVLPWPGGEVELQSGSSMASYMLLGVMMLPHQTHVPHALTVLRGGYDGMGQDRVMMEWQDKVTKEYVLVSFENRLHLLGYTNFIIIRLCRAEV